MSNPLHNSFLISLCSDSVLLLAASTGLGKNTFDTWCAVSLTSCFRAIPGLPYHQSFPNIPNPFYPLSMTNIDCIVLFTLGLPISPTSSLENLRSIRAEPMWHPTCWQVYDTVWLCGGPKKDSYNIQYMGETLQGPTLKVRDQVYRGMKGYISWLSFHCA
jgi:hypothetical protein